MNTANSPVILTPLGGLKMTYLIMPVQIRAWCFSRKLCCCDCQKLTDVYSRDSFWNMRRFQLLLNKDGLTFFVYLVTASANRILR
jgi:hypothetical protein